MLLQIWDTSETYNRIESLSVCEASIKLVSVGINVSWSAPVQMSSGSVVLVTVGVNPFFTSFVDAWVNCSFGSNVSFQTVDGSFFAVAVRLRRGSVRAATARVWL
jgi:hypothetical protein